MDKLRPKQRAWIDYYIQTGNASEAARLAGYKGCHGQIGCENLKKLDKEIRAAMDAKDDARIAKADEVLRFWSSMMRGEIVEEVVSGEGIAEKKAAPRDRLKASEMLAKRYGLLTERVDMTVNDTGVVYIPEADPEGDYE